MRRRGRRLGAAATAFAVLALGIVAAVRAASPSAAAGASPGPTPTVPPTLEVHAVPGASYVPALQGRRPLFLLVIGSGAHPGQPVQPSLSDSIHLIGVNLRTHRATIMGIPRDTWVSIPGHGMDKINTASVYGGPQLLATVVASVTGITPDFWVRTSFIGLAHMVTAIGGLRVHVLTPMHDPYSQANFNPGWHLLTGPQALAFARDRHSFANGDLSRSGNAGVLMLSALRKLENVFRKNPARVLTWMSIWWRNVSTDLPVSTLLQLAWTATQIPLSNVNNVVPPATTGMQGAASVVYLSPSAQPLFRQMQATGTASGRFKPEGL